MRNSQSRSIIPICEEARMNPRRQIVRGTTSLSMLLACALLFTQLRLPCQCPSCVTNSSRPDTSRSCECHCASCETNGTAPTDLLTHALSVTPVHGSGSPKQCERKQLAVVKATAANSLASIAPIATLFSEATSSPPTVNGVDLATNRVAMATLYALATVRIRI